MNCCKKKKKKKVEGVILLMAAHDARIKSKRVVLDKL